ncbi:MAG: C40 family peptidase [bacterium]|nr:C40 family peptidase [bacterium]
MIPGDNDPRNQHIAVWGIVLILLLSSCASTKVQRSSHPVVNRVLIEAEDLIGTSYCSRGTTPDCFDCSGFASWCYAKAGVTLPRSSKDQYSSGVSVEIEDLVPGDLVFFITYGRDISHVGIYAGHDKFVHSSTSSGVMISSMNEAYWKARFFGARRILKQ